MQSVLFGHDYLFITGMTLFVISCLFIDFLYLLCILLIMFVRICVNDYAVQGESFSLYGNTLVAF